MSIIPGIRREVGDAKNLAVVAAPKTFFRHCSRAAPVNGTFYLDVGQVLSSVVLTDTK